MSGTVQPDEDSKKLKPKQLQAVRLRAMGKSVNDLCVELGITQQTYYRWKKKPHFIEAMEEMKVQWIEQYENSFTHMLPEVAKKHRELLHSPTEGIAMKAVDSAHQNHIRCVREKETKSEVEELKDLVRALSDQLAQMNSAS